MRSPNDPSDLSDQGKEDPQKIGQSGHTLGLSQPIQDAIDAVRLRCYRLSGYDAHHVENPGEGDALTVSTRKSERAQYVGPAA